MQEKSDLWNELGELERLLADPSFVSDYKKVAEASRRYAELQRALGLTDAPISGGGDASPSEVIVEIRAGAGGDEAGLFAASLFQMYRRYAKQCGWNLSVIDYSQTPIGGYKHITFEVDGKGSFIELRMESGVHRVQRIPETEKSGRVHTSTVTVAVLPKASERDVQINPVDLDISFYRSGGPGGQNVNKVSTAVRVLHKPSGLVVSSQEERSQARNKERALDILRTKLLQIEKETQSGAMTEERRRQIGTGDRSEKIRTYNFPQDRITDHRIKKSWSNIEKILDGNLSPVIKALKDFEQSSGTSS